MKALREPLPATGEPVKTSMQFAVPMRTTRPSSTHLVLIPSYNPGEKVYDTVRSAREHWSPVWVIVDGSTDGSTERLLAMAEQDAGLHVIVLPHNQGKGAAVLTGLEEAARRGFTHVLTMDSDGQHPANLIARFMAASQAQPDAMVLGLPKFDSKAPKARVYGRRLSNVCANLETLWSGIGDSLYGFRVYPVVPLRDVMSRHVWMRRFDFDPEAAVRLCWEGVRPIQIEAPVRYFRADEGGVSHFNYLRDNLLLSWMHLRLFFGFLLRLPVLIPQRLGQRPIPPVSG
ncbi:Glycosyltransferase involved in cell wall bisynthesis [Paraburkholderia phenazinium]|jgi:glycosyltransferase involved in cell wall biosynthesis|uniref:Glycosyltransferase involved in cell wall bisynthesis n=2 Tax=Burkholderiaceae TaxID=119060 RepID=A0A1N6KQN2_9BURK|nr:Glycosyltransferase involved in cell wall bisynthesis [Paraburkholderia phenazinium]